MKNRSRIGYILQEITIVVVGVLIAVSIGNYKDRKDNRRYIRKTLLAIENEIMLSRVEVDTALNNHLILMASLENMISDDEKALGELIGDLGGVQFPLVKNISLRFFISNKAELVDFKIISQLLEIEEQTNILSQKLKRLADFAYEHMNDKGSGNKRTLTYLLANVIESEEALLESYSDLLKHNKSCFDLETP